jgi:hypothetical protein
MKSVTFDQIRGPLERVVYIALGYLVARGYITSDAVAGYATLVLAIIAALYGWWQNRPKAIMQSAEALPGTQKIITTNADLANDSSLTKTVRGVKQ